MILSLLRVLEHQQHLTISMRDTTSVNKTPTTTPTIQFSVCSVVESCGTASLLSREFNSMCRPQRAGSVSIQRDTLRLLNLKFLGRATSLGFFFRETVLTRVQDDELEA